MNKKIIIAVLILITVLALGVACYAAPPNSDYQLILSDEFDGTELNTDIWTYRSGNPYGGKNLKENVRVDDGMLYLDYRKVDGTYTGGGILTPFTLPYGYYEVEAKVYNGAKGLHTSFWTSGGSAFETPPKFMPYNNCFIEIDAFEIDSREDDVFPNVHHGVHNWCGEHTSPFSGRYNEIDASADFFVMGMEWLPDKLNYYINGELISSYDGLSIYGPSYMWLTAVAMPEKFDNGDGTFSIDDSKMDENGYFGSSLFKYFRYYQRPLKNVNLLGNNNFEYNKVTSSPYPSTFVLLGDKAASYVQKTPLAYDGFCYHTHQNATPYNLSTGQEFHVLIPGKYTFKGQFKATSGLTTARLVVYDENENVIAEKAIPEATEWTEVALTDIEVDGYAYVAVESASNGGTMLSIDALEFYTQEGEAYTNFNTPLYETSLGVDPVPSTIYTLDNAVSKTGTWSQSGVEEDTYWLTGTERDVEVTWEIPAPDTDSYRIELRNIIHENNTDMQTYYITLPDGTTEIKNIDTKNGETSWITLGSYPMNKDDIIKISLKSQSKSGNVRVTKFKISKDSDYLSYNSTTLQLGECVFAHKNTPYAFDKSNTELTPYLSNGTYYIPYQKLKEVTGYTANIPNDSVYVTTAQLQEAGIGVTTTDKNIFLHEKGANFTENIIEKTLDHYMYFTAPFFPVYAAYLGTSDVSQQTVKEPADAEYYGLNWTDSNHNIKHKYTGSKDCYAQWTITAPAKGEYSLDIYSPSYPSNSTTRADVHVYSKGERNIYMLNQTESPGWYKLSDLSLEAGEEVRVVMKYSSSGFMRVGRLRLAPMVTPVFVNDKDALNQEYYDHTVATKKGGWQNSTGVYTGCCTVSPTEENKDASISWNITPAKSTEYSIQIYVPKYTSSGAKTADINLNIDGVNSYYYVNQQANSPENTGNGWYELGRFNLTTASNVNITLANKALIGWLRAKAVRLVPVSADYTFVNNESALFNEYYSHTDAKKTGTWITSDGVYTGCIASSGEDSAVSWTVSPKNSGKYDVQIFVPKFSANATASAGVELDINGKTLQFEINEKADSDENPGVGWYSLGSYSLKYSDILSVTMTNTAKAGWLRAKAIRLIPEVSPMFAGNFEETDQELLTFESATKTGTWTKSGAGSNLSGCYYGSLDSTITWNVTPSASKKYSIQVYIPTYIVNASSTTDGYVTLTIDGVSHTFSGINQQLDPTLWQGWYDLGLFDLTPNSSVTVTMGKNSGSFIRAKDMRLVPFPESVPIPKSGTSVTIEAGTVSNYAKTVILAEYNDKGVLLSTQVLDAAPTINATMSDADNSCRLFFWSSIDRMIPILPVKEN